MRSAVAMMFALACVFLILQGGTEGRVVEPNASQSVDVEAPNGADSPVEPPAFLNLLETRIAGGDFAEKDQFPFTAVVHRLLGNGAFSVCGGSVISKRWILTAAHCLGEPPYQFLIILGVTSKNGTYYDSYDGPGVSMLTTEAFPHPQFGNWKNDIALIRMPKDIPYGKNIRPIRLAGHKEAKKTFAGETAYVVGWGKEENTKGGTQDLKYTQLPVIKNSQCGQYWTIDEKHVCTAEDMGTDACQGDSGGPLFVMKNNKPLQIGIVSFGDKQCPSTVPGVFTRVSSFATWIKSKTGIQL